MDFEILTNKKSANGKIDMLSNVLIIDYDKITITDWILIDDFTVMALDVIAAKLYGSSEYSWLLVKFNRISNPLEVNVGDVIAIPDLLEFRKYSKWVDYSEMTRSAISKQSKSFKSMKSNSSAVKVTPSSNFVKKSGNVIF